MNKLFHVTASHVAASWCFTDHPAIAKPSPGLPGKWYATSDRLGCSRDYDTPEAAVKSLFHANACSNVRLVQERSFATEFPDFPVADMPAIPGGFIDTSWHNDVCPSFTSDVLGLTIWVDYADVTRREHQGWLRFRVTPQDHGVDVSGEDLETDDWADVETFITARTLRRED